MWWTNGRYSSMQKEIARDQRRVFRNAIGRELQRRTTYEMVLILPTQLIARIVGLQMTV